MVSKPSSSVTPRPRRAPSKILPSLAEPGDWMKPGWQAVLRSRHVRGPYEDRIVLDRGATHVNGPHQGAWVDTPSGESWFVHFLGVGD